MPFFGPRAWTVVLGVMTGALVVAACGSDEPSEASSLAVTQNRAIAERLGVPVTDDEIAAEERALQARSQELIATCMAGSGFDYTPLPFGVRGVRRTPITDESLGISVQLFDYFEANLELMTADPNFERLQSMTPEGQQAWRNALNGDPADFDPRYDSQEEIQAAIRATADDPRGCERSAVAQALDESPRDLNAIEDYSQRRWDTIRNDPRYTRAESEWPTCMAEAGFPLQSMSDMFTTVTDELSSIYERFSEFDRFEPGDTPPPEIMELADQLREREAMIAKANAACREPIEVARAEVTAEFDEAYLAQG